MQRWDAFLRISARKVERLGLCVHGDKTEATRIVAEIYDVPTDQVLLEAA